MLRIFVGTIVATFIAEMASASNIEMIYVRSFRLGSLQQTNQWEGVIMQLPVQITFRNMDSSPAVEARVREEAEKLSEFYDGIMGCRVMVEMPHQHRQRGKRFHIRIDLTLPGGEIVVKHEPSLHGSIQQIET
ncbi:MAG: HPF/RaiA family ribosome-associated protein, partial [Blastocatellia bacterium]